MLAEESDEDLERWGWYTSTLKNVDLRPSQCDEMKSPCLLPIILARKILTS